MCYRIMYLFPGIFYIILAMTKDINLMAIHGHAIASTELTRFTVRSLRLRQKTDINSKKALLALIDKD